MIKASVYIYLLLVSFFSLEASSLGKESEGFTNTDNAKPYAQASRIQYISDTLAALHNTDLQTLLNAFQYINVIDRNSCKSNLSSLRLECMLSSAADNCQSLRTKNDRNACRYYSDIIVVNKLSEKKFIGKSERYQMAKNNRNGDISEAIARRLIQKYARITTMFALSERSDCEKEDFYCLASGIDQFCLDYTNKESLSWQYCTGAVLWFMGTSRTK